MIVKIWCPRLTAAALEKSREARRSQSDETFETKVEETYRDVSRNFPSKSSLEKSMLVMNMETLVQGAKHQAEGGVCWQFMEREVVNDTTLFVYRFT